MGREYSKDGEKKNAYSVLVGSPEEKKTTRKSKT
jgi:hypothetical protein